MSTAISAFAPLVTGGQLPLETARDLLSAARDQLAQAVTYADGVSGRAAQMAEAANARAPGSMRFVASRIKSASRFIAPTFLSITFAYRAMSRAFSYEIRRSCMACLSGGNS